MLRDMLESYDLEGPRDSLSTPEETCIHYLYLDSFYTCILHLYTCMCVYIYIYIMYMCIYIYIYICIDAHRGGQTPT